MQGAGAAWRCTVPGCAPFSRPIHKKRSSWMAAAAVLFMLSPGGASAADSAGALRSSTGMIYVDSDLAPRISGGGLLHSAENQRAVHPIYRQLRDALDEYRQRWGALPQFGIPEGPPLGSGASGERVRLLRERLGLGYEGGYDAELEQRVRDYQSAHALPVDGIVGSSTLESLNRGAGYYERLVRANLDRARALPADPGRRYILVDAAAAQLWMYEDGRPVDSMRVIVGKPTEQTPMLAAYIRYAILNPYWNVPPDLVQRRIAPNVLDLGHSYLQDRRYEVLSGWEADAEPVDPSTVDWQAVADGRQQLRVRQLPGPGNMMGEAKFMMSDRLGIYLHDTPDRDLFGEADRRLSSGCVRLEDVQRLSEWLLGRQPTPSPDAPEQRVHLPEPVPVFITYLTAAPSERGLVFREDVYGRDSAILASVAP